MAWDRVQRLQVLSDVLHTGCSWLFGSGGVQLSVMASGFKKSFCSFLLMPVTRLLRWFFHIRKKNTSHERNRPKGKDTLPDVSLPQKKYTTPWSPEFNALTAMTAEAQRMYSIVQNDLSTGAKCAFLLSCTFVCGQSGFTCSVCAMKETLPTGLKDLKLVLFYSVLAVNRSHEKTIMCQSLNQYFLTSLYIQLYMSHSCKKCWYTRVSHLELLACTRSNKPYEQQWVRTRLILPRGSPRRLLGYMLTALPCDWWSSFELQSRLKAEKCWFNVCVLLRDSRSGYQSKIR